MDTVLDTVMAVLMVMASASDTTAMVDTMARGLLMLSPRLMPIPTTMVDTMVIMVWATPDTAMDTVLDTTAVDMVSMDTVMAMAMATTDKSSQTYLLHTKSQQGA